MGLGGAGGRDEGRRADGLTTAERQELGRLRGENRQLRIERGILSKAAAWFARETGFKAANERAQALSRHLVEVQESERKEMSPKY